MEGFESLLGSFLSEDTMDVLSKQTKESPEQIQQFVSAAVPVLVGAMGKNALDEEGEKSLAKALGDHSEKGDDVVERISNPDTKDGKKIVKNILGEKTDTVVTQLAEGTGVTKKSATNLLSILAPVLLTLLAKNIFGGSNTQTQASNSSSGSILGALLGGGGGNDSGSLLGSLLGGGGNNNSGSLLGSLLGGGGNNNSGSLLGSMLGGGGNNNNTSLLGAMLGGGGNNNNQSTDLIGSILSGLF